MDVEYNTLFSPVAKKPPRHIKRKIKLLIHVLIEASLAGQADRVLCNPGRAQIHCSIAAGGRQ